MKKIYSLLLGLIISVLGFSQQTFEETDNYTIEEDTAFHCQKLTVSGVGTITDEYGLQKICVDIDTYEDGQLFIYLVAPDGTTVELASENGGTGDDYNYTCFDMTAATNIVDGSPRYNGSFVPEGDLSLVNNFQNADGTWQLCLMDNNGDDGSTVYIDDWKLYFDYNVPAPITRITTCSADWYDLEGDGADYLEAEYWFWVICPDEEAKDIGLDFSLWDVEDSTNDDRMTIWNDSVAGSDYSYIEIGDGMNTLDGHLVRADNQSGCLTIRWATDGDTIVGEGWKAHISCYVACQKVQYVYDGSTPAEDTNHIAVCQGTEITFSAHGVYPESGDRYDQEDATSIFRWNFGDGSALEEGTTVSHTYADEQGYDVDLEVIDAKGCRSRLDLQRKVMVSITPTFNGTHPDDNSICLNTCTRLIPEVQTFGWDNVCIQEPPDSIRLIDVSNGYYYSDIDMHCFVPGSKITSVDQIDSVILPMEHTWVGDLVVWIICPDGTEVELFDGNDNDVSDWMGIPYSDDTDPEGPGEAWYYSFKPGASTLFKNATVTNVTLGNGDKSGDSVDEGTYRITDDSKWADLIGCPLNGTWTIKVLDDQGADDGWLFIWDVSFADSLYADEWGYDMVVSDSVWTGSDVNNGSNSNVAEACVTLMGDNDYKYTVTDQFGCSYDTTITITATGVDYTLGHTDITCYGYDDGTASVNVTDGTPTKYTWKLPDGTTGSEETSDLSKSWTNLTPGTFYVTVENSDGCENYKEVDILEPAEIVLDLTQSAATCGKETGSITINVSGGILPFDYKWNKPSGNTNGQEDNSTDNPYLADDLEPGDYGISVTDDDGCKATGSITVNDDGSVTAGFSTTGNTCFEDNSTDFTSSASTSAGDPVESTTYEVTTPGGSTINLTGDGNGDYIGFEGDEEGTYTVKQTVTYGNCSDTHTETFELYKEPVLSLVTDSVDCYGNETGKITASITNTSGTTETYSFTVGSGSFSGNVADDLDNGDYTVVVVDGVGCNDTLSTTVYEPDAIVLSLTSTDEPCYGDELGTADVSVSSGGSGPFSYDWGAPGQTHDVDSLDAIGYTVTVTDANGCTETGDVNITEPADETYTTSMEQSHCDQADGDAHITVTTSPASSSYEYWWYDDAGLTNEVKHDASSSSKTSDLTNVLKGDYWVKVQNHNGCEDVTKITITDNGAPTLSIDSYSDLLCNGDNSGKIKVKMGGVKNPNYDYTWTKDGGALTSTDDTNSETDEQTGLAAGDYSITVEDVNGCTATATQTLTEPDALNGTVTIVDANCSTAGSMTLKVYDGTYAYSYEWSHSATETDSIAEDIYAGDYDATVTDANGCEIVLSGTVADVGGIDADTTVNVEVVDCIGTNEGAITANPIGGESPYTYKWDDANDQTTQQATGLIAGDYKVTVTDKNGCVAITGATIKDPDAIYADITDITDVSCNGGGDGSITASAHGGTESGAYDYSWSDGQTTAKAEDLAAGDYSVTVEDDNGCTADTTVTVNEPDAETYSTSITQSSCNHQDGAAHIDVTSNPASSSYEYWWYDDAGLTNELQHDAASASTSSDLTNQYAKTYYVKVENANGCSDVIAINVTDDGSPTISVVDTTHILCNGKATGMIKVKLGGTLNPDYDYAWTKDGAALTTTSTSSETDQQNSLLAGDYVIEVTDDEGCKASVSQTLTEPDALRGKLDTVDAVCLTKGSLTATVYDGTSPYTYEWPDGSTANDTDVYAGTFTVTVTDDNACTLELTGEVKDVGELDADTTIDAHATCYGDSDGAITANPIGGTAAYTYQWDDDASQTTKQASGLKAGTYTVIITDKDGCTAVTSAEILEPTELWVDITDTTMVSCYGGNDGAITSIGKDGSPGYTYSWTNGDETAKADTLTAGTYKVVVTDTHGCTDDTTVTIHEPADEIYTTDTIPSHCEMANGTAHIDVVTSPASSSYEYWWYDDAGLTNEVGHDAASASTSSDLVDVVKGDYWVKVQNANGCEDVIKITITDDGYPTISVVDTTHISCHGYNDGMIKVKLGGTLTPNYDYTWTKDGSALTTTSDTNSDTDQQDNLYAGDYSITMTDSKHCSVIVTQTLTEPKALHGTQDIVDANCSTAGSMEVKTYDGTGPYTYTWDHSATETDSIADGIYAGDYSVTVEDAHHCTLVYTGTLKDVGDFDVDTVITNIECHGDAEGSAVVNTVSGHEGTAPYTYQWDNDGTSDSDDEADVDHLLAGTYHVTVEDANGCRSMSSVEITEPSQVYADITDTSMISCHSGNDGHITASAHGGTVSGAYDYSWNDGQTTATADNLVAGTYTVTVEDDNGCTADTTVTIHEPSALLASVHPYDAHCDQSDGSAIITISGGTTPYMGGSGTTSVIKWSDGVTPNREDSVESLPYGDYSVTVYDANSCDYVVNFSIDTIERGVISISHYENITCHGDDDGMIRVSVGGGGGSNTYNWDNGIGDVGSVDSISSLSASTYHVTATDTWGCTLKASQEITEPTQMTLSVNHLNNTCHGSCDGKIDTEVKGGTQNSSGMPYTYDWSHDPVLNDSSASSLCAANYIITVTDAHDCFLVDSAEITEPASITMTSTMDSSSCNQSDGKLEVTNVDGGTAGYTYEWGDGLTGTATDESILDSIPQGNYYLTITDSKGCAFDTTLIVYDQNAPTAQIDSIVDPTCNESDNGEVYASATGGVTDYTWNWESDSSTVSSTSNVATNLDGGNVCVTVTDQNGCKSSACTTLVENPQIEVRITTQDVLCNGDSTGVASAVVTGGTGAGTYTYEWTGSEAYVGTSPDEATDSNLVSGTYNFQVTDTNNCTVVVNNIDINQPTHIALSTTSEAVKCNSACDGKATISASGGEGSYEYLWPDGQTSATASGLCADTYIITVTDGYGCVDSASVTVTEPEPFVLDSIVYKHITCYGSCDGSVVTYVSGGVSSYNYTYSGPSGYTANTQSISDLCLAGKYDIHVEDDNGCEIDTFHIVNQPPELRQTKTKVDESCSNYCDGEIHITISGGTGSYSIDWSDGQAVDQSDRTNLCPGDYKYTITDDHDCEVIDDTTILGNPLLQISEESVTDAACGNCDGEATVSLSGGISPFTISWFGGDFSSCDPTTPYPDGGNNLTETHLPQGIHHAYVEDGNGCRDTVDIVVNNQTGPTIDTTVVVDVICNGESTGSIDNYISGGTAPLDYSWADDNSISTEDRSSLPAGTYYFSVTDNNDCVASAVIDVTENDPILININNIEDVSCHGLSDGSAIINAHGGTGEGTYSYSWSDGQTTAQATGLAAGDYTGVVTDTNHCTVNETITIEEPDAIVLVSQTVVPTTCAYPQLCDGSITVAIGGGYSSVYHYNWFGNGDDQNVAGNLCAGDYDLQVKDENNCTADFSFTVDQPDTIRAVLGEDPIVCDLPNGMVWIESITGGTGSDYNNTATGHQDNSYPLGGSSGWDCNWDVSPSQSAYVANVMDQTYTVQIHDPNNYDCFITEQITVGSIPAPYLLSTKTEKTSCSDSDDGSVMVNVRSGTMDYSYTWPSGASVDFVHSSDSVLIDDLAKGSYNITVVDNDGCKVPVTFVISSPNPIIVNTSLVPDERICISQSAIVYANGSGGTGAYEYNWHDTTWNSTSAILLTPALDTMVSVNIRDEKGCLASTQRVIYVNKPLHVTAINDGEICEGDKYELSVVYENGGNGNYSYEWSQGSTESKVTVKPLTTETYYVTLSDDCGTPDVVDTVVVQVNPNPYINTITQKDSCEPLGVYFTPYPADTTCNYQWNFGDPISGDNESNEVYPSHFYEHAGKYDIMVHLSTDIGCTYDTIFNDWIIVHPVPEADFSMDPNPATLFNNTVTFTDITECEDTITNVHWDFGNGETAHFSYANSRPKSSYANPGYYDVVLFAESQYGCKDTVSKVLRVNDEYTLYAPDAFSPGQDGRNDYFYPVGHGLDNTKEYKLEIHDRWGMIVFETDVMPYGTDKRMTDFKAEDVPEEQRGWNGRYQNVGDYVQNDIYTWSVRVIDVNGVAHEAAGRVNVIR